MVEIEWVGRGRKHIFDGTNVTELRAMPDAEHKDKKDFSDEELEEIMDMHGPQGQISIAEVREIIKENPLLVAGLVFAFGLLVGVSLSSSRRD